MQKKDKPQSPADIVVISVWASAAAFVAYFSMYGFRKPFAVAKFSDLNFLGTEIELKTAIVISQIVGYALSKYIGIWGCSAIKREHIWAALVGLVCLALGSLFVFAIVPTQWKVAAIFFNGLPLGMVWGLVVRYLEGRRSSDIMLAVLCFSFMIASGVVKDTGKWLIDDWSISESWMPFYTGLIFLPSFVIATVALAFLPQPTEDDIILRVERKTMTWSDRWLFIRKFMSGLIPLFIVYTILTAYRDFRDNYGIEMLTNLGFAEMPAVFTRIEFWVAVSILAALGLMFLVKDNRASLHVIFASMVAGGILLLVSNYLFVEKHISGFVWMILIGLGAYAIYVPFNAVLFERMVAATGTAATAVFAIYVADALGYTGSIIVQLYKDLFAGDEKRDVFFINFTWLLGAVSIVCLLISWYYFLTYKSVKDANVEIANKS